MKTSFIVLCLIETVMGCTSGTGIEVAGNLYCSAVSQLQYTNVGTAGSYNEVTYMGADGTCHTRPKSFSGPLSPLDGEVSVHFRGPLALKQFAVYSSSANNKRQVSKAHLRRHHEVVKVASPCTTSVIDEQSEPEAWVTATINGDVVSWTNNYFGPSTPAPTPDLKPLDVVPKPDPVAPVTTASASPASKSNPTSPVAGVAPSAAPQPLSGEAAYTRTSYYDSESQTVDSLTFLGNYGGQGSGVWDDKFGNSLSYINSMATSGSPTAQILSDTTIESNQEFTIMTDKSCTSTSCGYVRPGSISYHGFGGAAKIFLFEFIMPLDTTTTTGFGADMPAIWLLNAQIPRTAQYHECSCWSSGCGEFDIMEVLSSGSLFAKTTLHTNTPAGSADYLVRPTEKSMKLAVVFDEVESAITVKVLEDGFAFDGFLSRDVVDGMVNGVPSEAGSLAKAVV